MPRRPDPTRPPPPLDAAALERLALRYVERFATTRAKLTRYLTDKVRARGWAGAAPPDPGALAARMAALGYIDDAGFAAARGAALTRRGYGAGRVRQALRHAGIDAQDAAPATQAAVAARVEAALTLARRKRIGPYAAAVADRPLREKQLAALLRAGHELTLARAIVALAPGDDALSALAPFCSDDAAC